MKFRFFLDRKKSKIFRSRNFSFSKFSFKIVWKMKNFEIEIFENLDRKKSEVEEVRESFWYFFFIECLRIKSIRPGNIFTFNFQRDYRLNIDSRKIKKVCDSRSPNQGNEHKIGRISWNHTQYTDGHLWILSGRGLWWKKLAQNTQKWLFLNWQAKIQCFCVVAVVALPPWAGIVKHHTVLYSCQRTIIMEYCPTGILSKNSKILYFFSEIATFLLFVLFFDENVSNSQGVTASKLSWLLDISLLDPKVCRLCVLGSKSS